MKRGELYALQDILQAIDEVAQVVEGRDLAAYERDFRIHRVVERCVEIVSEASRRLSAKSKARFPEVPWHAIEAIGNKLRHEYRRLDAEIMWKIATKWPDGAWSASTTRMRKWHVAAFSREGGARPTTGTGPKTMKGGPTSSRMPTRCCRTSSAK